MHFSIYIIISLITFQIAQAQMRLISQACLPDKHNRQ